MVADVAQQKRNNNKWYASIFRYIYIKDIYRYRNIDPLWSNIIYGSSCLFKYLIKCYIGFIDYCYAISNALLSSSASKY